MNLESKIGEIYILIENLKIKDETKRELQNRLIKLDLEYDKNSQILWGMAKALRYEGLIDNNDFIKIVKFISSYDSEVDQ